MQETDSGDYEVRLMRLGVLLVPIGGGFVVLTLLQLLGITQQHLPTSRVLMMLAGATVVTILGVYLYRNPGVRLRLTPEHLDIVKHKTRIPWSDIADVDWIEIHPGGGNSQRSIRLFVMTLTDEGLQKLASPVRDSQLDQFLSNHHHVGLRMIGWSCVANPDEVIDEIRRRMSAATGTPVMTEEQPVLSDPELKPTRREGNPHVRSCRHRCGEVTVVSGRSLHWLCNPMRFADATVCAYCGAVNLQDIRWDDTGEPIDHFRKRLFRHTPMAAKLFNFVVGPAIMGLLFALLLPTLGNIDATTGLIAAGAGGVFAGILLIWITPLAGFAPWVCGQRYSSCR